MKAEVDEKLKWILAAVLVVIVSVVVWQFVSEGAKPTKRKREPWEMV